MTFVLYESDYNSRERDTHLLLRRDIERSSGMEDSLLGKVEQLRNIDHVLCRTLCVRVSACVCDRKVDLTTLYLTLSGKPIAS